jgi:hypothetical protein
MLTECERELETLRHPSPAVEGEKSETFPGSRLGTLAHFQTSPSVLLWPLLQ